LTIFFLANVNANLVAEKYAFRMKYLHQL